MKKKSGRRYPIFALRQDIRRRSELRNRPSQSAANIDLGRCNICGDYFDEDFTPRSETDPSLCDSCADVEEES